MVKLLLSVLACLSITMTLSSCMDDPITIDQAIPQNITRPSSVGFRFLDYIPGATTGDIRVYWTNSSSDRQQNFEGYVVRLMTTDSALFPNGAMGIKTTPIAEQIVGKTVFEAVFTNVPVNEDYVVGVWGKRFSTVEKPDSLVLSRDSMAKEFVFDPRPLENPTVIRAASVSPTKIRLEWDGPSTHAQRNLYSYTVFYRDPSKAADSNKYARDVLRSANINFLEIEVPPALVGAGISLVKEYEFWVKAVRVDSMQFYDDSTLIRWSGGERITSDSLNSFIRLGQGLFIGNVQGRYGFQERDPNVDGWMKFEDDGENVKITGLRGTMFYSTFHGTPQLDTANFSRPLEPSEYDQTTLTIPKLAPAGGWTIYAKLFGLKGEVVRLRFRSFGTSIVTANNAVGVEMIYQPERGSAAPLPYF